MDDYDYIMDPDDISNAESDMELSSSYAGPPPALGRAGDDHSTIYPEDSISVRGAQPVQKKWRLAQSVASDAPSLISFHSSADGHLFKTLHGRAFNNQSDLYMLPADDHEHYRLDMQHRALTLHLGSLYASRHLVEAALRPDPEMTPVVLDVGTGSGRWAIEIALQFPQAEVVGLDIVPPVLLTDDDVPSNCRFEVDDANLSLEHYEDSFNVVHLRSASQGINDFESWLYEIARTLRPNGVLLLVNGYPQMYDDQYRPLPTRQPGEEGFTWVQFLWTMVWKAMHNRGNFSVDNSLHWQRWLESNPNYQSPKTRSTYVPLGPWNKDLSDRGTYVAALMREDCIRILENFKPLLLGDGKKEAEVDQWIANATRELHDLSVHAYSRWQYTVAVRTELPWQERLEKQQPIEADSGTLLGISSKSDLASAGEGIAGM